MTKIMVTEAMGMTNNDTNIKIIEEPWYLPGLFYCYMSNMAKAI